MITDSFDDKTEALVSLETFYGKKQHIIDKCIVTFSYEIYEYILKHYDCTKLAEIRAANGRFPIYAFTYEGMRIGFYLSAIGSAMAALYVMEANWMTGAEKFIMFGSAGSLNQNLTTNKYVIPTQSYRDEGMSYHYAPAQDFITVRNHGVLKNIFDELKLPNVEGRVWTTDAFLRETVGQIEKRKEDGCVAVEMELAGVQAVCDFHGLQLYDFLVTGDVLTTESYDKGELSKANHSMDKLFVALEIAKRI